ncbi:MAG: hypothetical protein LAN64_01875 [Acidobacteriia bacterium]|nr:hypothetical protein [Terriglobia bacterium]
MAINPAVDSYIEGILSGQIAASRQIKRVLQRHLADLGRVGEPDFPFYFDLEAALNPIRFIETFIVASESDDPIVLLPWEQTWLALLFGWKRKDGTRRYRRTLLLVAKKNGKTALAAALALYCLVADGELSARVFMAATTKKQARVCFTEAVLMRKKSPELKGAIGQSGGKTDDKQVLALYVGETGSRLSVMARDADSEDGAIVSHCIIDELHRWKTKSGLYSVLRYGGRTRKQPLMIEISTAGDSANSTLPCWEEYEHGLKCLDPANDTTDDEFLPFLYVLDQDDDWKDEANWPKSNPSLGGLFGIDKLRSEFKESQGKPGEIGIFKRFCLNLWSQEADDPAIDIEIWDQNCRVPIEKYPNPKTLREQTITEMAGLRCYAALDPAFRNDTSALFLVFPPSLQGERYRVLPFFWVPETNIAQRVKRDRVPYDRWAEAGFLEKTPGDFVDHRYIARRIVEINKQFDLQKIAYDESHCAALWGVLEEEGFPNDKKGEVFPQRPVKMSGPCRDWMLKVDRKEIAHDHNPVLRWQVANLRWKYYPAGNLIMPDKGRNREKIDGVVAMIMAFALASENMAKPKKKFFMVSSSEED